MIRLATGSAAALMVCVFASVAVTAAKAQENEVPRQTPRERVQSIDAALADVRRDFDAKLSVQTHSPWQLFHAASFLGPEMTIHTDRGVQPFVDFLQAQVEESPSRYPFMENVSGRPYFVQRGYPTRSYQIYEDHTASWLGHLALGGFPDTTAIRREATQETTLQALLNNYRLCAVTMDDNSWLVIANLLYSPAVTQWTNKFGQTVTVEGFLSHLIETPNDDLACGGAHKLHALGVALRELRAGHWRVKDGQEELAASIESALERNLAELQRTQDVYGLLSLLPVIAGERTAAHSLGFAIYYNGHALEWVCDFASPQTLNGEWIQRAVDWLVAAISDEQTRAQSNIGYLAHAVRALQLYRNTIAEE